MEGLQDKTRKKVLWTIKSNLLSLKRNYAIHFKHKNFARVQLLSPPRFPTDLQGAKVLKKPHSKILHIYRISK